MSESLLGLPTDVAQRAAPAGADEPEVFATVVQSTAIDIKKGDIQHATSGHETSLGVRVLLRGCQGFASVNDPRAVEPAIREAIAIARAAVPDPVQGFADADETGGDTTGEIDPELAEADHDRLAAEARRWIEGANARSSLFQIESAELEVSRMQRAVANTRGVGRFESQARAGMSMMGMAVDGDAVSSFDHDSHEVVRWNEVPAEAADLADRLINKTVASLRPRSAESFRGLVVLSPEVVLSFLLGNTLSMMEGRALRTGRSPLQASIGRTIASPNLTVVDDPTDRNHAGYSGFDREGIRTESTPLIDAGVMVGALRDVYESRRSDTRPRGHARGGATSLPSAGPSALAVAEGQSDFSSLCCEPERAVLVTRFSGNCNPSSGDFSGVVKGGFLLKRGQRTPIKETLIAGNLYEALRSIVACSRERRLIGGRHRVPAMMIDGVSVTAGTT